MQKRALLLLLLALVLGGVAVILVNMMLRQTVEEKAQAEMVPMTKVVVAAVDLKTGTRLSDISVKEIDLPTENLPEGVYHSVKDLIPEGEMAPPIVLKKIAKNELILPYKLSPFGARSGLPPKIPEDMRAITIEVNEVSGVAGFVLPGDFVDVLLTSNIGRKDKLPATRTLLQNIQVLGVDQLSSEDEDKPKVVNAVTLLITPKEGKMLSLASKVGQIGLLLRNEFDASIIEQEVVSTTTLLEAYQETKPKVTKRIRRVVPTVEVIRGLDIQKQRVQEAQPAE